MVRSAIRKARPTMPPATPPAIAAVFDFEVGVAVLGADGPAKFAVGTLPETDDEVGVVVLRADGPTKFAVGTLPEIDVEVARLSPVDISRSAPVGVFANLVAVGDDADGKIVYEIEKVASDRKSAPGAGAKESWPCVRCPSGHSEALALKLVLQQPMNDGSVFSHANEKLSVRQ